jgi:serine/threonine-protein kinase HipA
MQIFNAQRITIMVHELHVWLFANRVGILTLLDGRLHFCYTHDWLSRKDAVALSISLPLQSQPFHDAQTRAFFAGLLPEGRMRRLIAERIQASSQNDFALLDHIGGECAGAVTFLEPGQSLSGATRQDQVKWLSHEELSAILEELPHRPMLAGEDGLRLSLAGAQDKLPVVFDGARIGLPLQGTSSSHILKPAIRAVEDSVVNEGFCMALAESLQLKSAKTIVYPLHPYALLLIERYDRMTDAQGYRQRLHQEDFCQALGIVPEMKYQNEGGPNLAACFHLVRRATRPSAPQVLRLLDGVIFNALIGNNDAHAKNFSLLYSGKSRILAPFYDILSTAVYPKFTPKMAMKIDSKYKFSEIQARHWEQFVEEVGLSRVQVKRRVLALAKSLPAMARALQAAPNQSFSQHPVVEHICKLIEQRCTLTTQRLGST